MQPLNKPVAGLLCSTAHDIPLNSFAGPEIRKVATQRGPTHQHALHRRSWLSGCLRQRQDLTALQCEQPSSWPGPASSAASGMAVAAAAAAARLSAPSAAAAVPLPEVGWVAAGDGVEPLVRGFSLPPAEGGKSAGYRLCPPPAALLLPAGPAPPQGASR